MTRCGAMIGAAILRGLIGTIVGPGDLDSSICNNMVITSGIEVSLKVKLLSTLFLRNVSGDIGVWGIYLSLLGPTLAKKLLKAFAISLAL